MNKRGVELEVVKYRADDIAHAGTRLLYNYAQYSGIQGTEVWFRAMEELVKMVRTENSERFEIIAPGLDVHFSGFTDPVPTIQGERVIYSAREPRFIIEETEEDLLPSRRNHIHRVTQAIASEMEEVFHLRKERSPYALIFPKSEYARSIDIFPAVLLI